MPTEIAVVPPTCEELHDGKGFKKVQHTADDSWRHGSYVTDVFQRESDGTFWSADYRLSTDQETNELREGIAAIARVYPHTVQTVVYLATPEMPRQAEG